MDGQGAAPPKQSAAMGDVNRQEFNSAYASLEHMIRNYGKEKLKLQQCIDGLVSQLKIQKEQAKKLSLENEDTQAENKRLQALQEESEKVKSDLEALLCTVERKQEIICDTIETLEKGEQGMSSQLGEYEEFIHGMKCRQLRLKKWIDEIIKQNKALEVEALDLQQEKNTHLSVLHQLNNARLELSRDLEEELMRAEDFKKEIEDLKSEAEERKANHSEEIAKLKAELNVATTKNSELQNNYNITLDNLTKVSEELINVKNECNSAKEDNEKIKLQIEELNSKHTEEITKLNEDLKQSISKCEKLDEDLKMASENQAKLAESLEASQNECNNAKAENDKLKSEAEQQTLTYTEEVTKLTSDLSQANSNLAETQESLKIASDNLTSLTEALEANQNECNNLKAEIEKLKLESEEQTLKQTEDLAKMMEKLELANSIHAELEKNNKSTIEKLEKEIDRHRREKRELLKRYQDQKQAISKMVEEVGVRPVILPSTKGSSSRSRVPVSPANTQDTPSTPMTETAAVRPTPKTPVAAKSFPEPTTPSRLGILKRNSLTSGDRTPRNVSFGPTSVSDFVIASDTDESSTADADDKKEASRKRMKFSEKDAEIDSSDEMETDKNSQSKEPSKEAANEKASGTRRYIKRGILKN